MLRRLYHFAEFVGADELFRSVALAGIRNCEQKSPAVRGTAAPGIPVFIGKGTETVIFCRQILQGGINGLFFRADQADLHVVPFL